MKKIIFTFFVLFTLNASAGDKWDCSNRPWGFGSILDHIDVRSELIVLSKETPSLKQANRDLKALELSIKKLRPKINAQNPKDKKPLKLIPVVVKKGKQYVVIFDECLTETEAGSISMEILEDGKESTQIKYKNVSFEAPPKEETVGTCSTGGGGSHPFRYIGNHYLQKFLSLF